MFDELPKTAHLHPVMLRFQRKATKPIREKYLKFIVDEPQRNEQIKVLPQGKKGEIKEWQKNFMSVT